MWLLCAALIAALAWAGTEAGVSPGLFLIVNVFLMWILSPGLGAGVAIYATISQFTHVPASTIFVGFVSVCSVILLLLFLASLVALAYDKSSLGSVTLFFFQAISIFVGARVGKFASSTSPEIVRGDA